MFNSKLILNNFEYICENGLFDDINTYIKCYTLDINEDDGYYVGIICKRNDVALLRKVIEIGANVHLNNEGPMRTAAHRGNLEILDYLIQQCKCDCKILYDSTACSNKTETIQYLKKLDIIYRYNNINAIV